MQLKYIERKVFGQKARTERRMNVHRTIERVLW